MTDNPLSPVRFIKKRVREIAAELGLQMEHFVVVPADEKEDGDTAGVDTLQVVFLLTEESVEDEDQKKLNEQFRQIVEAEREQTDKERVEQQEQSAKEMLKDWDF